MTLPKSLTYRGYGDVEFTVIQKLLADKQSPMVATAHDTHVAAYPHSALFWAQAWLENQWELTGHIIKPKDHNPLSLRPNGTVNNPVKDANAIGTITASDGGQYLRFATDADCAREWKRRLFDDPTYKGGVYRKASTLEEMLSIFAPSGDVHPETGVDNADAKYVETVKTMLNRFAALEGNQEEPQVAGYRAHTWPGLKNQVWLPDDIKVEVKIINHPRFRSFQKSSAHVGSAWHDTGNSKTNARGEYTWANNGRQGAGVGGYNGIFDDKVVIITQPFDEDVWAAGTPVGNHTFYHFEQAWGTGVDFERSIEIGAAVHGGILAAKGWTTAESLKQHNYFYGKDCPGQIRKRGIWANVVKQVEAARKAAVRAAAGESGGEEVPGPTYESPVKVKELAYDTFPPAIVTHDGSDFVYVGDVVEAIKETPRYQLAYDGAPLVGGPIKVGEQFAVEWLFKNNDNEWFYLTPFFTRVRYLDTKRVADVAEVPE
jgi:hypothetical protein